MELCPELVRWRKLTILSMISTDIMLHCVQQYAIVRKAQNMLINTGGRLHEVPNTFIISYTLFGKLHRDYDLPCEMMADSGGPGTPLTFHNIKWLKFGVFYRYNDKPNHVNSYVSWLCSPWSIAVRSPCRLHVDGSTLELVEGWTSTKYSDDHREYYKQLCQMYAADAKEMVKHETL